MKIKYLSTVFALAMALLTSFAHAQESFSDSIAIQSILQGHSDAWGKGDAKTYSQHFAEDGTFTNILGMFFTGQKEFEIRHEQIFTGIFRGTAMKQNIASLMFVRPDVAVVETITWTSGFSKAALPPSMHTDAKGRLRTRLLQVMVKEADSWQIVSYHNVEVSPNVPIPEPR